MCSCTMLVVVDLGVAGLGWSLAYLVAGLDIFRSAMGVRCVYRGGGQEWRMPSVTTGRFLVNWTL